MKIQILKENQEKTLTQRTRKPTRNSKSSEERTTIDDFEDFDSFGDPAELEPLDDDELEDSEEQLDPKMMIIIKKVVEQELKNPAVLKAIAELIKTR